MNIPAVSPVILKWADVQIGMMTFKGMVTALDRRYTTDGGVKVTVGTLAPFFAYDSETVGVYGKVV
jgi:hypothetical protein